MDPAVEPREVGEGEPVRITIPDENSRFLMASLRAYLLEDLHDSFLTLDQKDQKKEKQSTPWLIKLQFSLLAVAGTILAICEGFDGIASMLSLFGGVPVAVIFAAGLAFSALSVVVFYGFDLVTISDNLGVKMQHAPMLIDVYLQQIEQIKQLRKKIDACYAEPTSIDELKELNKMVSMLKVRYEALDDERKQFIKKFNNPLLNAAKAVLATITGVLFFGGGFFAGQSLTLAVSSLLMISVSPTFWPVILASVGVGLAAFSIYWYVERPGLQNLVGRWFGLDKDNLDAFADDKVVKKQKGYLSTLEGKITRRIDDHEKIIADQEKIIEYQKTIRGLTRFNQSPSVHSDQPKMREQSGHPGFFRRTQSMIDLPAAVHQVCASPAAGCPA